MTHELGAIDTAVGEGVERVDGLVRGFVKETLMTISTSRTVLSSTFLILILPVVTGLIIELIDSVVVV